MASSPEPAPDPTGRSRSSSPEPGPPDLTGRSRYFTVPRVAPGHDVDSFVRAACFYIG